MTVILAQARFASLENPLLNKHHTPSSRPHSQLTFDLVRSSLIFFKTTNTLKGTAVVHWNLTFAVLCQGVKDQEQTTRFDRQTRHALSNMAEGKRSVTREVEMVVIDCVTLFYEDGRR